MGSRLEKNKEKQDALEDEERKKRQVRVVKRILKVLFVIFLLSFLFCFYVSSFATVKLIVKEEMITSDRIPLSFDGYKVIQFSDLHFDNVELLEDVIESINVRRPDLILFTGDLLKDEKLSSKKKEKLKGELKKLDPASLKYAVLGETDQEEAQNILTDCGFIILDNTYDLIYHNDNNPILLMGMNTNKKIDERNQLLQYYNAPDHNDSIYSILMLHKPDSLDQVLTRRKVDLAFAGHSHLGEIRIPYLFSLGKKEGALKYTNDYYEVEGTRFYISSGIGTDIYTYRFFDRPSITFLRLSSKAS